MWVLLERNESHMLYMFSFVALQAQESACHILSILLLKIKLLPGKETHFLKSMAKSYVDAANKIWPLVKHE